MPTKQDLLFFTAGRGGAAAVETYGALAPDAVSGLALWLKADAITGLNDGDAVTTWSDASGNGRDATGSGSNRPVYKTSIVNGEPVVRFTAASSHYLSGSSTDFGATTVITLGMVVANVTAATAYNLFETSANFNNESGAVLLQRDTSDRAYAAMRQSSSGAYADVVTETAANSGIVITTNPRTIWVEWNRTRPLQQCAIWIDGVYLGGGDNFVTTYHTNDNVLTGNFAAHAWYLGSRGGASNFLAGDIGEVLLYSRRLTLLERWRVERHLNDKWNVHS